MMESKQIEHCIGCSSSELEEIMDFGQPYLNDFQLPEVYHRLQQMDTDSLEVPIVGAPRFPLKLVFCSCCKLVQLAHHAPQDWSFRNYWYRSGITKTMRDQLQDIVNKAQDLSSLKPGDAVLDIGANDGTMLRMYYPGVERWGFEPALNLQELAKEGDNHIIADYFGGCPLPRKFKVITAIAMFYDVPNPAEFLQEVYKYLDYDGVFIIQMNYLKSMLAQNAFDNIGHEHLAYYSLTSLNPLLYRAGLHPFAVGQNDVNGGSFRVYCRRLGTQDWKEGLSITQMLEDEKAFGLDEKATYQNFAERLAMIRHTVSGEVEQAQARGEKVYVLGASTRGSTTLQYFKIPGLEYAVERDPRKIGRVTSGTWLKIIDEEQGRRGADVFLVLPWPFKKEIVEREKEFLARGGKLLFPLPEPCIVTLEGETKLF